jgi:transcriptional regulator with XRE-family HTH domain
MSYFAESLKILRQKNDLSMQTLADKAGVSKSMISKIERDEVQPTLDVAARLAKALGKTLSEMLHAPQTTQIVFLPRAQQAIWEDADHIKRRNISPVFEGLKTEWLQVELPPKSKIQKCVPLNTMGAEKFILVTKNSLKIQVNEEEFHLQTGDSLYFDASCPHSFSNDSDTLTEFYIVIKHAEK